MTPDSQVTPEDVVEMILDKMQEQISPSYYKYLVPNIFNVYLHSEDFERLRGLHHVIREEAVRALDEEIGKLNRPKAGLPDLPWQQSKRRKRYEGGVEL